MVEIAIVSAKRTAIGNFNGSLSTITAHALGSELIKNTLMSTGLKPAEISEVILGQVIVAGQGQNPARQASITAGLLDSTPAWIVNQVCGSGLKSIMLGCHAIASGESEIVLAGGQENMSKIPHAIHLRNGLKMGNGNLIDLMVADGLTDAFSLLHMGLTAENIAEKFNVSREEQDEFSTLSQNKAEAAQRQNRFKDEIVPITIRNKKGDISFETDEFVRSGATKEGLLQLKPAFKKDGTITAGNASGINDGAALVALMRKDHALKKGLIPLAVIKSFAQAGVPPEIMGIGQIPASQRALEKANWKIQDLDLIEINEAFAAQSIYVNRQLKCDISKVNVNGGAIALGHPIGASGARILVTLLHEMKKRNSKKGLASLCIGGGMGVAMCIERS